MQHRILSFLALFVLFCSANAHAQRMINGYTKYEARVGKHRFKPNKILYGALNFKKLKVGEALQYEVVFDKTMIYEHGTSDQKDWNKGGGWSFNRLTNHKNSSMWAWRWNTKRQCFEITTYSHAAKKKQIVENKGLLCVSCCEQFSVVFTKVNSKQVGIEIKVGDDQRAHSIEFIKTNRAREIELWFGGNRPSPVNGYVFIKKTKSPS